MRCEQMRELLSPYMDQMTNEKETRMIEAHLVVCPECKRELEQLQCMVALMGNLESPQLPEHFSADFHRRLMNEQPLIFRNPELKRPRKQAWIAAGVAGLALTVGVYASSLLPMGMVADLWQDKENNQKKTTTVAVDDIIQRIQLWGHQDKDIQSPEQIADKGTTATSPGKVQNLGPASTEQPSTEVIPEKVQVEPKLADVFKSTIKVDNLNDSVSKVVQIAEANGAQARVTQAGNEVQALNGITREVSFKVSSEQVGAILKQLETVGQTGMPVGDQVVYTEQYSEAVNHIQMLENQISELDSSDEANRIKLQTELQAWRDKKVKLEKELQMATIKVQLVQEVNP